VKLPIKAVVHYWSDTGFFVSPVEKGDNEAHRRVVRQK
jgi:hypothetical protein